MEDATDVNGLPRLSGQSVDLGAHEFSPTAAAIVYVSARPEPGDIVLTWPSTAGHTYALYGSSNLTHGFDLLLQDRLPATPPVEFRGGPNPRRRHPRISNPRRAIGRQHGAVLDVSRPARSISHVHLLPPALLASSHSPPPSQGTGPIGLPVGAGPAAPPVGTGPHGLRFVINGESAATLWGRVSDAGSRIYLPRAPAHSDPPPRIALRRTRTSPYPGVGCRADRLRQGLRNWADSHRRGFSAESDFRPPTTDLRLLREAAATKRSQSGLACRRSAAAFHVLRPSRSGMRRSSEAAA